MSLLERRGPSKELQQGIGSFFAIGLMGQLSLIAQASDMRWRVRWHSAASPPHLAGSGMAVGPPCSIVANLLFPVRCVAGLLRAARGPGKSQKPDRVENPLLGALLGSASRRRVQCA